MNVILTVGASGAGKSTWAKEFIKANPDYLAINRDSLRLSIVKDLKGYYQRPDLNDLESIVNNLIDGIIFCATAKGYNLLVDNTNLTEKYINQFLNHPACKTFQIKLFPIAVGTAKYRVLHRDFCDLDTIDEEKIPMDKVAYIDRHIEQYNNIEKIIKEKYHEHILL